MLTPNDAIGLHPSGELKQRVAALIYWEKTIGLTQDETSELDHYMQLEHLMRLAKAHDRRHLSQQSSE